MDYGSKTLKYKIITFIILFLCLQIHCNKEPSPHYQNALDMMKGHLDYSDPVFKDVLSELHSVPENDPNYEKAQELISRIESVRDLIITEEHKNDRIEQDAKLFAERVITGSGTELSPENSLGNKSSTKDYLSDPRDSLKFDRRRISPENGGKIGFFGTPTHVQRKPAPTQEPAFKTIDNFKDDLGHGEQYWKNRKATLESSIENLKLKLEEIKEQKDEYRRRNKPKDHRYPTLNDERRAEIEKGHAAIQSRYDEYDRRIKALEEKIEAKQKELDGLAEELRKAGGLPGWLR